MSRGRSWELPLDGIFVAVGIVPNTELMKSGRTG